MSTENPAPTPEEIATAEAEAIHDSITKDIEMLLARHKGDFPMKALNINYLLAKKDGPQAGCLLNVQSEDAARMVGEMEIELSDFKAKINANRYEPSGLGGLSDILASLGAGKATVLGPFKVDEDGEVQFPKPSDLN